MAELIVRLGFRGRDASDLEVLLDPERGLMIRCGEDVVHFLGNAHDTGVLMGEVERARLNAIERVSSFAVDYAKALGTADGV
jgi:hypothetical protein